MATENKCPHCGKPVPATALGGICPECMLKAGLVDTGEVGPDGTVATKPTPPIPRIEDIAPHFPQLEILACLGRGGMGAVYKARQPKLDRLVALKILTRSRDSGITDTEFAARFQQEARALARLNHPDIVAVYDFGEAGGFHYLLMEYMDGLTLRQLLQTKKLSPEEALAIVPKICEALQFAHERGIVHRDIKPENILLDKKGRVKIADFGIAKILGTEVTGQALTGVKDRLGTPHYMAPEQVEKPTTVDHRADIYSLGVVFYEMLTGELPLGKFQPPSKKVHVDVRLDEVVLHALEKEPDRRYQHASEVKTDVETIAAKKPLSSGQIGSAAPVAAPASRRGNVWKLVAVVVAAGLLVLAVPVGSMLLAVYLPSRARQQAVRAEAVVRVEEKLRSEILRRLNEGGWKPESLSVSVTPDLERAECRFGVVWKKGLSQEPFNARIRLEAQGNGLWLVRGEGEFESLRFSVNTSVELVRRDGPSPKTTSISAGPPIAGVPPVVVKTVPESGSAAVDPALAELRVTFSKPMQPGGSAWVDAGNGPLPGPRGSTHFLDDGRTCIRPVKLEHGKTYAVWINHEDIKGFQDTEGQPAVPYLLIFETRK